jgi:hypothetical protein
MTTRAKRLAIVAAAFVAISAGSVGGYYFLWWHIRQKIAHSIATQVVRGGATRCVDTQAWTQVSIGMSREAVIALLGDAPSKRQSSSKSAGEDEAVKIEYWEYNYASGLGASAPHPKAYVVCFDRTGKVSGFRPPTE